MTLNALKEDGYAAAIAHVPGNLRYQLSQVYVLFILNRQLNTTLDTSDVVRAGNRLISDLLELDGLAIYAIDRPQQSVELLHVDPDLTSWYPPSHSLAWGQGIAGRAVLSERQWIIEHDQDWPDDVAAESIPPQTTVLAERMLGLDGEVIGVVIFHRTQGLGFANHELPFFAEMARDMGHALSRAQVLEGYRYGSLCDGLTGLYNRIYVKEQIEEHLRTQQRYGTEFSTLILDVDHFKEVNDSYGHCIGDEVLRIVATRIRSALRDSDTVGRYGGEEFIVLLPNTSSTDAAIAADKVRRAVADEPILAGPEEQRLMVTITVGVAAVPHDAQDIGQLLEIADRRLYLGKLSGRNSVVDGGWQESVEATRRRAPRYAVTLSTTNAPRRVLGLEILALNGDWRQCIVEDISRLGVRLKSPVPPENEQCFKVRMLIEDRRITDEPLKEHILPLRVAHYSRATDGYWAIGGLFVDDGSESWQQFFEVLRIA
ncbi:diguanylate cyclase/phosphodiesterase with PAS/PAC sensor [Halorhodospira halochloris]|uniref:diguanylate cyclase n=1 Tax=Halorhodospira halochloris TaxID=1052 RepID=A0A0X8XAY8_HALHR|nr:sensor domain-containing diguanylate cyclase [Halorhodospira halochloris]MBK1651969.1 hypothetical protein [Halorhodospira halochloris]BAU58262.1 diguanylate cyclase/phosphodiesterase with PAS/PAC sensor [Halorhodospira halochloris]